MEYNKNSAYKTVMLVILTVIITFIITTIGVYNFMQNDESSKYVLVSGTNSELDNKIARIKNLLNDKFLGEINEEEVIEGAVKGYVEGLDDKYTEYMTKDEWSEFAAEAIGNYVGIGIYMSVDKEDNIVVLNPMEGSPAKEAGLQTGDIISKVNGEEYTGDDLSIVSSKIKGEEGTKVKLEIIRNEDVLEFEIERRRIEIYQVVAEVLEDNIGYLQLSSFDEGCSQEFEEKFKELKQKGIKSLIIDLRYNGGGIVEEAIKIADLIVPKGKELLITVDKNGNKEIEKSKNEPIIDMDIIVLVNEGTASASEILSGALKNNEEAILLGTKTYGKGVMQHIYEFSDGSAIKVTTEEFYTPGNNKIHEIGIEPDIVVELPTETVKEGDQEYYEDTQLKRAIQELKEQ